MAFAIVMRFEYFEMLWHLAPHLHAIDPRMQADFLPTCLVGRVGEWPGVRYHTTC